jgi:electron transport complex protein RnfB
MLALTVILSMLLLTAAITAWRLARRARLWRAPVAERTERINRLLPQTQCGQCGYDGCKPYAVAIAEGTAEINQCPPGGERGIRRLASLLGREVLPMNPANGVAKTVPTVARIEEELCIGCLKCIQACPVDAIVGANQLMHTVITAQCTGCELCVPPCPVDCIVMEPVAPAGARLPLLEQFRREREERQFADISRQRHEARQARLQRETEAAEAVRRRRRESLKPTAKMAEDVGASPAQDPVAAALARARAKKAATATNPDHGS